MKRRAEEIDYDRDDDDIGESDDYQLNIPKAPGKNDPKLFSVEVFLRGKEYELVLSLLNKYKFMSEKDPNIRITGACCSDS